MGDGAVVEPVTADAIRLFLETLSNRYVGSATIYLLGGSALCLLGSPRETQDVDYTLEVAPGAVAEFNAVAADLAKEMQIDLEEVPIGEFIPLPPHAAERRRRVGQFGLLEVYIFDLYSIALSKIARGFESDLDDVLFMLREKLIAFDELEGYFNTILPRAPKADILPAEFVSYFEEVRSRYVR
jgi:hypothetical protein